MVTLLIVAQFIFLLLLIWKISNYFVYFYFISLAVSIAVMLYILGRRDNPSYKLAWAMPILLFPLFGGLCYILFSGNHMSRRSRERMQSLYEKGKAALAQEDAAHLVLEGLDPAAANQSRYLRDIAANPVYQGTESEFYPVGEAMFEKLLDALRSAERFIFLEYFIVQEGEMWNAVLEILEQKVQQGVEVRVLYDDMGCLQLLPFRYDKKLRKLGIQCEVFNQFRPYLSFQFNHRDHRKIAVIDGAVGFTGGINLADEYINAIDIHGHWKDTAIRLRGDAVWSLTVLFLQMWDYSTGKDDDFDAYRPDPERTSQYATDGFVQPYGDSPMDGETIAENVYLNILRAAQKYVYITTPYLIVDNELVTALSLAAKSGVDVRIITPKVWDKWFVHVITQSYYPQLIDAGVKIYEYTPGFIHSKTFVCDDTTATVGTVNLDYRSLYLHYECGVWMYRTRAVDVMKRDFLEVLQSCEQITAEVCRRVPWYKRAIRSVLRVFAPLM